MREGLGPAPSIMIDCGIAVRWDVPAAVKRVQAMEEYDLAWIEEPLGAWDPEGYATLRAKTTTAIAYGEKEWTVEGYERLLATGTVDVVGVDPGRAEGITGFKKVCDRVEAYDRQDKRPRLVVGHRQRSQHRGVLQHTIVPALRVQAASQPDAERAGQRAAHPRRRLGVSAGGRRPRDRGR